MAIKQLVEDIKKHVKRLALNADFIELFDVDNNTVTFYVADQNAIVEGVEATPDGEFLFSDGTKIVIEGGKVVSVEAPVEEAIEEEIKKEEIVENEEVVEEEEIKKEEEIVEEPKEDKDARIAELEAEVEKLKSDLEAEKAAVTEKEEEIKEIEEDLKEIQNFYTKVKKQAAEREIKSEQPQREFYFIKRK